MPQVIARIEPPATAGHGRAARVRVRVQDVSLADAAAETVGETVLEDVDLTGVRALEVAVDVPHVDRRRHYTCYVHVDRSGNRDVEPGDLVSTASHPVLTRGHGDRATVPLHEV